MDGPEQTLSMMFRGQVRRLRARLRGSTGVASGPLYRFWNEIQGLRCDLEIRREIASCRSRARALGITDSAEEMQQRLLARLTHVRPKPKGQLRILFLSFGSNHEDIVGPIPTLRKFGEVCVYRPPDFSAAGTHDRPDIHDRIEKDLRELLGRERAFDVVLGQMSGQLLRPRTVEMCRATGAVVINYCWNDAEAFYRTRDPESGWSGPAALAKAIDLNLTSAPTSCLKYAVEGGIAFFWPEAGNPDIHCPPDAPRFRYDVTFIGSAYGYRPFLVEHLRRNGVDVVTFGPGWPDGAFPASYDEWIRIYRESRINLGFGGVRHSRRTMVLKTRDFEVPMSGALYLTSYSADLELCYEIGKEIVCYQDKRDCLAKVRHLLANPDLCDSIRKAARRKCLMRHTWELRFDEAFRLCGLIGAS